MTGTDYLLTRISPEPDLDFRDLTALGGLDPYGLHRLAWTFFDLPREGKTDQTPFLFRAEVSGGLPILYLLSSAQPRDPNGKWRIESKAYRPRLAAGERLAFKLRANPTVKRPGDAQRAGDGAIKLRTTGAKAGQAKCKVERHDVVMDAKRKMNWTNLSPEERPPLAQIEYEAGSHWLHAKEERLGCQFNSERLRVYCHNVHRMRARGITLSILDFEGELRITDGARFADALLQGIGPAKAFGCGLLLVRRIAS